MSADGQSPKIYRPTPRRPFNHDAAPQQPPSPLLTPALPDDSPSRTHSIMNLTSSTLMGIYSPTGYETDRDNTEPSTPWGTGAETPFGSTSSPITSRNIRKKSITPQPPQSTTSIILSLAWRSTLLFVMGMGYGGLVRHLHDDRQLAPFQVEGIIKPRNDWTYLVLWGVAGVALGSLLPYIDTLFCTESPKEEDPTARDRTPSPGRVIQEQLHSNGLVGTDWQPAIRSVGAFMGIAFAIVWFLPHHFTNYTNLPSGNSPGHHLSKPHSHSSSSIQFSGTSSTAQNPDSSSPLQLELQEPHYYSPRIQTCYPVQPVSATAQMSPCNTQRYLGTSTSWESANMLVERA